MLRNQSERAAGASAPALRVKPLPRYGRWIASALVLIAVAFVLIDVMQNPRFHWDVVGTYLTSDRILRGLGTTLLLTALAMLIGVVLGVALAVLQVSKVPLLVAVSNGYVWFFRGTPLLVQIIFWFNIAALYPEIGVGIPFGPTFFTLDANQWITPFAAGLLALSLNEAAYMAEIVRAGLISVDPGQMEAADSIGMSRQRALRRIVLPQAMRVIIPPTGNQTIGMLKTTSLVSVVAVSELLYSAQNIAATTFQTIPLLITASIWYIAATTVLSIGQHYLEKKYARGTQRGESAPTLLARVLRNVAVTKQRREAPSTREREEESV